MEADEHGDAYADDEEDADDEENDLEGGLAVDLGDDLLLAGVEGGF